jgi:hypothetical protein
MMETSETKLGLCIKNAEKLVQYQDELCLEICGDMQGQICEKGCMKDFANLPGMTLVKNAHVDGDVVDTVVIKDQGKLTTLLYKHRSDEEDDKIMRAKLISFGLSKSELAIFLRFLKGHRNADIAREFFISKATLKTHLNNIYKKLPNNFQIYKQRK